VKEFVAQARAKPGSITFGSSGVGGALHLAGELRTSVAGNDRVHVRYKGMAAGSQALIVNEITSAFAPYGPVSGQLRAGKLRALASLSRERSALLPDVPSMAEAGFPAYEWSGWIGILAPAKTPRAIVDRLNAEINRPFRDPQFVKERVVSQGYEPVGSTPERFAEVMREDAAKFRKVVQDAKIPPE
jgi:tripartite-type tricarboxylate transporter receptor subunit TctC